MAELIQRTDTLNEGREKLNAAIVYAEESRTIAQEGKDNADAAAVEAREAAGEAGVAAERADTAAAELEGLKAEVVAATENADSFVYVKEYDPERTYAKNNMATYDGSTYIALTENTGVLPSDSTRWGLVARRGVDGMGSVASVNGKGPDEDGNITLTPAEVGAASEQSLTTAVTQLEKTTDAVSILKTVEINVLEEGAEGDGETNDYRAIIDAIDKCVAVKAPDLVPILRFPYSKGFATDSKIVIPNGISVIMDAPLFYTGTANEPALVIGASSIANQKVTMKLAVKRSTISDWTDENSIGIQIMNPNTCNITIIDASYFTIGVQIIGSSQGASYNNFILGNLFNNKIAIDLTNENTGWCNENKFDGGRFWCNFTENTGKSRYGVRINSKDDSYLGNNNNVFEKPSFELQRTAAAPGEAVPLLIVHGKFNRFSNCRNEGNSELYFARTLNESMHNEIEVGYSESLSDLKIDDQGTKRGTNTIQSRWTNVYRVGNPIFLSGSLHKKACYYDGSSKINVPGVHVTTNSGGEVISKAEAGLVLNDKYIEIPAIRGVGIFIDTQTIKKFIVRKDAEVGYGGRVKIRCYDLQGGILDDTSIRITSPTSLVYSGTTFGKHFTTSADSNGDFFFNVSDEVKKVCVILAGGTNPLRLRSFSIHAMRGVQGFSSAWTGYDEMLSNHNLAVTPPTVGAWEKGKQILNDNQIEHGATGSKYIVEGWACLTAGSPGTWVEKRFLTGN